MAPFKLRFWLNLIMVVATSYIITWYIFTPSNNKCQMTYMMEPPKFLLVPVSTSPTDGSLSYPSISIEGSSKTDSFSKYKLYMYSEFGFPQESNVGRDLKDSMPVLFVPGNAGSYQQVRSIASTCIRRQLQSLEAFKFIFYTIDFEGQLSGISGQLIEDQTSFVHQSLNQIMKMHPSETNGVILIGHSVGGFISKVLFTKPDFDANRVPLLISLASPLTKPYLAFDNKMLDLYKKTNRYWSKNKSKLSNTISLSISGGKSDRLVPEHLSMDPQYDLSLTTSSIKDVWLATDHVCITWCRELMNKLANLLSSLMDRKQTQLISDKKTAISIILSKLLMLSTDITERKTTVINKDWRTARPITKVQLEESFIASRLELSKDIFVIDVSTKCEDKELFIFIDHIGSLKETGLFGCREIYFNNKTSETNCRGRVELNENARFIPTPRFEPKRTLLSLKNNYESLVNHVVLDFVTYTDVDRYSRDSKIPESLLVQRNEQVLEEQSIYIPTLIEYIFKRILFMNPYVYKLKPQLKLPIVYLKYKLQNLKQKTQILTLNYEAGKCLTGAFPKRASILFSQDGYLSESVHLIPNELGIFSSEIKLKLEKSVLQYGESLTSKESTLELYIDGTCETYIKIEFNIFDLIVQSIQRELDDILTCTTFIAYISIIFSTRRLNQQVVINSLFQDLMRACITLIGFVSIDILSKYLSLKIITDNIYYNPVDQFTFYILTFVLSTGVVAFIDYFLKRLIDLATILNRVHSGLRRKLISGDSSTTNNTTEVNGEIISPARDSSFMCSDIDWILIGLILGASFVFSTAVVSLFTLFIIVKFELDIAIRRSKLLNKCSTTNCMEVHNPEDASELDRYDSVQQLMVNVGTLCSLALISNVPTALLRLNSGKTFRNMISSNEDKDETFFAAALALLQVKFICAKVCANYINVHYVSKSTRNTRLNQTKTSSFSLKRYIDYLPTKHVHLLSLVPILFIYTNLSYINLVFSSLVVWLNFTIKDRQSESKAEKENKDCNKLSD